MALTLQRPRGGFTLVEMLVVVLIIGILMGLLTPAILAARARARRIQCTDNQQNLGKAIAQYELSNQKFPGYVNPMPGQAKLAVSWPVVLLKQIDRADLSDAWRKAGMADLADAVVFKEKIDEASKRVALLICPSDNPTDAVALSYVANCGQPDAGLGDSSKNIPPDWPANGIFLNRYNANPMAATSRSDIKDGTQHTLLISENMQASAWNLTQPTTEPPTAATNTQEPAWGMVWWPDYKTTEDKYAPARINADLITERAAVQQLSLDKRIYYARPSSFHPGGAVATFCDGHTQFLNEQIDYLVYQLIMTPDGSNAKIAGDKAVPDPVPAWRNTPLDAASLE